MHATQRMRRQKVGFIPQFSASAYVLGQEKGKERFLKAVTQLSKAFALSVPHDAAIAIRDDVGFYQTLRAALAIRLQQSSCGGSIPDGG
ncbi:MAG: type I restriction enzyme endonuclease domain-containing protein [Terriglobales bacterium]